MGWIDFGGKRNQRHEVVCCFHWCVRKNKWSSHSHNSTGGRSASVSQEWICVEMSSRWIGGNERVVELIPPPLSTHPVALHSLSFPQGSGVQHMASLPIPPTLFFFSPHFFLHLLPFPPTPKKNKKKKLHPNLLYLHAIISSRYVEHAFVTTRTLTATQASCEDGAAGHTVGSCIAWGQFSENQIRLFKARLLPRASTFMWRTTNAQIMAPSTIGAAREQCDRGEVSRLGRRKDWSRLKKNA